VKIWRCPTCDRGVRAPEKLAKLDTRRWCLKCSARSSKLVERTIPSVESDRARAAEARKLKTEKRQERRAIADVAAANRVAELAATFDRKPADAAEWLRAWAPRCVALKSLRSNSREYRGSARWSPAIRIRQGNGDRRVVPRSELEAWQAKWYGSYDSGVGDTVTVYRGRISASGRAWPWTHCLVMTTGVTAADDLSTLIHELAHLAAPNTENHGPTFQLIQREAVEELTGQKIDGWRRGGEEGRVAVIQRWLDSQKGQSIR
jgi:hypothetical protein